MANDYNGNSVTNKYQVVVPANSSITPTYDVNGNMTNNGAGQTYTWDAKNELISIGYSGSAIMNGVTQTQFTYDGFSRRIKIVDSGSNGTTTKQYVWVGDRIAEERDANGNVTKRFFSLGEQISGTAYYLTRDHLGSIREMVSGNTTEARYDYDPYGAAPNGFSTNLISGTNLSDFQYCGYYEHQASGLNLTKYRAYDPNTGRWINRDPIAERGGTNLYSYTNNNPLNGIDPTGQFTLFEGILVIAIITTVLTTI